MASTRVPSTVEQWRRRLRQKPVIQRYIELVYARFRLTGDWPHIRVIQRELVGMDVDFDVYGAGALMPSELGTNPVRVDGSMQLTILAVALCPDSDQDENAFVGFVQLCVARYKAESAPLVAEADAQDQLHLDELGIRRLSKLVEWEPFVWREVANGVSSWRVKEELIHHFTKVASLDDYLAVKDSLQFRPPRFAPASIWLPPNVFTAEGTYPETVGDTFASWGPWEVGRFRLFASHLATSKHLVGDVKACLSRLAIDLFVAHEDITPSHEWEKTILDALLTCDAIALFLVDGFRASDWTDQEVGFALARGVQAIPINLGIHPYGFAKRFQSLPAQRLEPSELAESLFDVLVDAERTADRMADAVIAALNGATTPDEAVEASKLLSRLSHWTRDRFAQLEQAVAENDAVDSAPGLSETINEFIRLHR